MHLETIADLGNLAEGFSWQSGVKRVGDIRFILFALATGDWNKIHINPFTAWRYKSNLNGLTCCGDFVLALTKPGIHKVFRFGEDVEIIARGYENVDLKRPLNLGMRYWYSYTLIQLSVRKDRAYCTWRIELKTPEDGLIASATWKMFYAPVQKRKFIVPSLRMLRDFFNEIYQHPLEYACICMTAALIGVVCLNAPIPVLGP